MWRTSQGERVLKGQVIACEFFWQEFQSYVATQLRILGLIHHSHATSAQLSQNPVVGDGSTDHARGC